MDYLDSYATLAAELKRQGWFRKATGRLMMEFAFHLATFVFGIAIAVNASSAWIWIGGVAISAHRWLNLFMAWIGSPILGQFSVSYWWKKHNSGHHRVPNVIGVDKDCDFMPLFAYCEGM